MVDRRLLNEVRKSLSKRGGLCNFRILNEDLCKPTFAPRTLSRWGRLASRSDIRDRMRAASSEDLSSILSCSSKRINNKDNKNA